MFITEEMRKANFLTPINFENIETSIDGNDYKIGIFDIPGNQKLDQTKESLIRMI